MVNDTDWLEGRSRLMPEKTAIVEGETGYRWSYRQLNDRATALANYFMTIGIEKGTASRFFRLIIYAILICCLPAAK